ncbi:hypothetical protein HPB52_012512 [Rhipicephalus sanguineus]|uniref:Uncharacterized protein n=1 Tax=Rhipicephalus sanguineus TaxID=34632 RepID=A0A9D4PSQ5_RHISA|nr:hypothetical protein HPB52_012512 [Rhipicephalus sanguineus]
MENQASKACKAHKVYQGCLDCLARREIRRQLEHVIVEDFPDVQLRANFMATLRERNCRKSQESKLDALRPQGDAQTKTVVLNLSSYKPTASEVAVLRKGLIFSSGTSPKPTTVTCAVERAVTQLPPEVRDKAQTRAVATCRGDLLADETLAERTPLEQCYKQIHGTAVGASITVTTANLVMEVSEQKALADFVP